MPSSCLWSTILCPSGGMCEGVECRSYSSCRKTVRKYYMRPQTLGEARRQRRNISRNSFFSPPCPHRPAAVGCWCSCFDSSPGLGQSPSVTHTYWLLADFGLFSSSPLPFFFFFFFFFFFNEFPLVFPDTVCG